jgi:hypothetical protein
MLELAMDKLTRNMSTQLFTGASKRLKTRLSTVTVRFFWRAPLQNLQMASSSHFQGLKPITYATRSFSPFDEKLKNDVGAPPPSEGCKTAF